MAQEPGLGWLPKTLAVLAGGPDLKVNTVLNPGVGMRKGLIVS